MTMTKKFKITLVIKKTWIHGIPARQNGEFVGENWDVFQEWIQETASAVKAEETTVFNLQVKGNTISRRCEITYTSEKRILLLPPIPSLVRESDGGIVGTTIGQEEI